LVGITRPHDIRRALIGGDLGHARAGISPPKGEIIPLIVNNSLDRVLELQPEEVAPESAAPLDRRQLHPHMRGAVFVL
jgi:hypothetical protein